MSSLIHSFIYSKYNYPTSGNRSGTGDAMGNQTDMPSPLMEITV